MTNTEELRDLLVAEGSAGLARPLELVAFTNDPVGNLLLNDLVHFPHTFVFGCLVDRQVAAERAWTVPAVLRERLGTFEMDEPQGFDVDEAAHGNFVSGRPGVIEWTDSGVENHKEGREALDGSACSPHRGGD